MVVTFAEGIFVVELPGGFIGRVVVVLVVVDRDDVDTDAVGFGDGLRVAFKLRVFFVREEPGIVGDVPELAFGKDRDAQAKKKGKREKNCDDPFFHAVSLLTRTADSLPK